MFFVQVGDVDWIEGLGDYAGLHVGGRTHLIREPLTSLEAASTECNLFGLTALRSSRWSALSAWSLRQIEMQFYLRDGKTLRVSRTYRSRLEALLQ
jgi:two-component system LytT family response regulator